jgi:hypothetical protein
MRRTLLLVLSVVVTGAAVSGCQSDAQKMNKGVAKEYQYRYNACMQSLTKYKFEERDGFGFNAEKGVCECSGNFCELGCNVIGKCSECDSEESVECIENGNESVVTRCIEGIKQETKCNLGCTITEDKGSVCRQCNDNEKPICISDKSYQVCDNGILKEIQCENEDEVCNARTGQCTASCGMTNDVVCQSTSNNGSILKTCIDGKWIKGEESSFPCGSDHTGIDENCPTYTCEDGFLSEYVNCELYMFHYCPLGCASETSCYEIPDQPIECLETCSVGDKCDYSRGVCQCMDDHYKCEDRNIYQCSDGEWGPSVSSCDYGCKDGNSSLSGPGLNINDVKDILCNPELPACTSETDCPKGEECDSTTYQCKCTDGYYKCKNKKIYQCNDDGWAEIAGIECSSGCTDAAPSNDISDESRLEEIYCLPSGGDKTCDNNFSCYNYMVKCQSGDDFIDINDASNANVLQVNNLGCAYDSANNRFYCSKQPGETIDSSSGCCNAEQTYCFGGKAYDCKSKRLEQNTNCDDNCAGKSNGKTVSCDPICSDGYYKCENRDLMKCTGGGWEQETSEFCTNGCKTGVGPVSGYGQDPDGLKNLLCAEGSNPSECDSRYSYVCESGSVKKCEVVNNNLTDCSIVHGAKMLNINAPNMISGCGDALLLLCSEFNSDLLSKLMQLQAYKCAGAGFYAEPIHLDCICNSSSSFSGMYYVGWDDLTSNNYRSLVELYVKYDGSEGTAGSYNCSVTFSKEED